MMTFKRPSIKSGTWNIPEHAGTFWNIPEHPGTRKNKIIFKKKINKQNKIIIIIMIIKFL